MIWFLCDVLPPMALILCGLIVLGEGKNLLATALIWTGVLQVGALNHVTVLEWLTS